MRGTRELWLAALLCTVVAAALFGATVFSSQAFFFRDVLHYYWQSHTAVAEALRHGRWPHWNPGHSMGLPLLADLHAGALYPPNLLYLVLPYPRAYAWLLVAHLALAGLGAFVLARQVTGRGAAAAAAAVAFMLSGYVVSLYTAGPLMAGAAYVPWVLAALNGRTLEPGSRVAAVAAGLCLQALSGDPQSALFSALAALAWLLWVRPGRDRALLGAAAFALGGLMAAAQLVPAWYLLGESTRSLAEGSGLTSWATHPLRLAELLLPSPFGSYLEERHFWAWLTVQGPASTPFALSLYLGASTLILAALALERGPWVRLALTLIGAGALFALGDRGGLGAVLEHVPPFRFFRYPEKYMLLATLGWSLLVGLGVARLQEGRRMRPAALAGLTIGGAVAAGVLLGSGLARGVAVSAFGAALERLGAHASPEEALSSLQLSLSWGLGAAALAALVVRWARLRPHSAVPPAVLVLVVAVDLLANNRRVVYTAEVGLYQHEPAAAAALRAVLGTSRGRFLRDTAGLSRFQPPSHTAAELLGLRAWELMTLKSNLGAVFGLEEESGYGAVELQRTHALVAALRRDPIRLAEVGGACAVLTGMDSPLTGAARARREASWPALGLSVLALERCAPRVHGVGLTVSAETAEGAAAGVSAPGFDPIEAAVVEGEPSSRFQPMSVTELARSPGFLSVRADVPEGGGFLVHAASFARGWSVEVDGRGARLVPTNVATQGVHLPAGRHEVRFQFRTPGLGAGAALSGLGLLAWTLLVARGRRWPQRWLHPAQPGGASAKAEGGRG